MEVFLSYSWKEEKVADTVIEMFNPLKSQGVEILRDKDRLKFMGNIKEFMKSIKSKDFAILLISDNYLKSPNCMHEITELMKLDDYKRKILVLRDKNANIFKIEGINDYLIYWQNRCNELEAQLENLKETNKIITIEELKKSENIMNNIGDFINGLRDLNIISFENNISLKDFYNMKKFLGFDLAEIQAIPDTYYIINVPRTICANNRIFGNTIIWWEKDNKGYTDNLSEARIFTVKEASELVNNSHGYNYGSKKFAAIPTYIVANLGQSVIPMTDKFMSIILKKKEQILGNKELYLDEQDISLFA